MAEALLSPWDFRGCRVLVTGAAHGIGAATASLFARAGAELILADIDEAALGRMSPDLGGARREVVDIGDGGSIARLAARVGRVDVLVNNAGVVLDGPLAETDEQEIRRLTDVDLIGPILMMRAFGPLMAAHGSGVIVNVGSQLGLCGSPNRAVYGACKAAISHLSASLAAEWGPRLRVVAIAPGRIATRMSAAAQAKVSEAELKASVALGRFGQPSEVAEAICFAASPRAAYVTGTTLVVDGGYLAM